MCMGFFSMYMCAADKSTFFVFSLHEMRTEDYINNQKKVISKQNKSHK